MDLNLIQKFSIWILPALFAITVHEAAHGYAARYFGDHTAALMGRLSLMGCSRSREKKMLGTMPGALRIFAGSGRVD